MHYLIDGYNLLFRLPKTKESLQSKRENLIRKLNQVALLLNLKATVVFDASVDDRDLSCRSHYGALELVYTVKKQTADEYIIHVLETCNQPKNFCVVTSDLELRRKSQSIGASTKHLQEFLNLISKKKLKHTTKIHEWQDSKRELSRLLILFEKRLLDDLKKNVLD